MYTAIHPIVIEAREAVLEVYHSGNFDTEEKSDHSPITRADRTSHTILLQGLAQAFPDIPIISEESRSADQPGGEGPFWLIDPLDGTKEFVRRTGEFTINVGLVAANGHPIWGLVDVPLARRTYFGGANRAFRVSEGDIEALPALTETAADRPLRIAVSRSHRGSADDWLNARGIRVQDLVYAGSAVKFCWIAEGSVDLYVRLLPTMGWDTAAGQAIVEAVGGRVTGFDGQNLWYQPHSQVNPEFVAWRPIKGEPGVIIPSSDSG